ncbi:Fe-S-containing hydro-lyase [Chitinivibrio alkaliphilus]|uniref:Fumarate hydratase, beta subunit n=1 Tax=Chitinivibrio alkaliphilus ACht1 TaxID=1313304 RepID=U7D646_9BACT|nr:Fe-S-containing hydro-lyase [Chitinivibrio alkaliphilus]ERP31989.1 fumarate hydratase, beta subunit [Chitinivibrio alkaliphilus ACht1]
MKHISLSAPLYTGTIRSLSAGDQVVLQGDIYTARDAAHKRLCELLATGKELPLDLRNQVIYYVGPTPAKPGAVIGSAGPTTSYRMDPYAPELISRCGLAAMIGKGDRSDAVVDAMKTHGAVYFAAVGGAAALISQSIVAAEIVAYPDLGPEAIRKLTLRDMPLIVAIDSQGKSLYT